jgi:antitoxin FitA
LHLNRLTVRRNGLSEQDNQWFPDRLQSGVDLKPFCNHNETRKEVLMPALTIKNLPDDLYQKLKNAAMAHRRSLNSELIYCLEMVLSPRKLTVAERLQRARNLRRQVSTGKVTPEEIENAIDSGRP